MRLSLALRKRPARPGRGRWSHLGPALLFAALLLATRAVEGVAQGGLLLTLWYPSPAWLWVEALPVGNGRLGAMVFGGPVREHIQFTEETM